MDEVKIAMEYMSKFGANGLSRTTLCFIKLVLEDEKMNNDAKISKIEYIFENYVYYFDRIASREGIFDA